jgi:hypothetical protein
MKQSRVAIKSQIWGGKIFSPLVRYRGVPPFSAFAAMRPLGMNGRQNHPFGMDFSIFRLDSMPFGKK